MISRPEGVKITQIKPPRNIKKVPFYEELKKGVRCYFLHINFKRKNKARGNQIFVIINMAVELEIPSLSFSQ